MRGPPLLALTHSTKQDAICDDMLSLIWRSASLKLPLGGRLLLPLRGRNNSVKIAIVRARETAASPSPSRRHTPAAGGTQRVEAADPAPRQLIRSLFRLLRIMRFMLIYIYFWLTFKGLAADYTRCSQIEIRVRSEYRDDEIHVLENKESKSAVC